MLNVVLGWVIFVVLDMASTSDSRQAEFAAARASAASASGWSASATAYITSVASVPGQASADAVALLCPEQPVGDRPIVVLDVAAGPATFAVHAISRIREAGLPARVIVTDFAAGMVDAAKTKVASMSADGSLPSNITVECSVMDGQDLSALDSGSVTHAACMFGIMFMPDRARCLAEIRRVLVPGGRLLVGTWLAAAPAVALPQFVRDSGWLGAEEEAPTEATSRIGRDPHELQAELVAAGFTGSVSVTPSSSIRMVFDDMGAQLLGMMMNNPAIKPLFSRVPPDTDVQAAWAHWLAPGQPGHRYMREDGKLELEWVANLALATA